MLLYNRRSLWRTQLKGKKLVFEREGQSVKTFPLRNAQKGTQRVAMVRIVSREVIVQKIALFCKLILQRTLSCLALSSSSSSSSARTT